MPIVSPVGRSWPQKLFILFVFASLTLFGISMAVPFLITLTGSASNPFDYDRFSIFPRSAWSKEDRFVKPLPDFINGYPSWNKVFKLHFPMARDNWTSWRAIGLDRKGVDMLGSHYLEKGLPPEWKLQAADYSDFALAYPLEDSLATFSNEMGAAFIQDHYFKLAEKGKASSSPTRQAGLELLSETWGVPINDPLAIRFENEKRAPMGQQSWVASGNVKWNDYRKLCFALQHGYGTAGVLGDWKSFLVRKGISGTELERLAILPFDASAEEKEMWREFAREKAPASPVIPFPMRLVWFEYLASEEAREYLKLGKDELFDTRRYNDLAGSSYESLDGTPFPIPAEGFEKLQPLWKHFIETRYPIRLIRIKVTPELQARYQDFLRKRYRETATVNQLLGTASKNWSEWTLSPDMPEGSALNRAGLREIWIDFAKTLSTEEKSITSSESAYQEFLRSRYVTLEELNRSYGWKLERWEEAAPPFDKAYTQTYLERPMDFAFHPLLGNYRIIGNFLLHQGNAIPVTLWLIFLSIFTSLTVNPIAGYALSRFNMKSKDKIILFCLATAAFPAMVSAIPGYLLMRDLGLLNTFIALVLPGAASGMAIFILKGFFDSLPAELYEAATIDGAREWQTFFYVTLPMVTPILAINALHAFMAAYGGWEWALVICQDKSMWTLSVWLYQASQWWVQAPWITTAGFVMTSIPTLIVFVFCQKVIMRGIIVPSMK